MDLDNAAGQPECRLLQLPPELRNQIWELLLIQNTHATRTYPSLCGSKALSDMPEHIRRRRRFCANILQTCKQVNTEGTPILYGENLFQAHTSLLTAMPRFLAYTYPGKVTLPDPITAPRVAKLIRKYSIHVRLDTDPRFSRKQVEESFSGVEELEIDVFQAMYGSCDFSVLNLFEDVRGVGKVNIQGSLGDGKYAAWLTDLLRQPVGTPAVPYTEQYVGGMWSWDAWSNGNR
ncbi:uncharacterized protein LTR77_007531 [Saxophila tyrrhenica]|uniref:DUF7730 domain-containing protein n=1 Tax=Saxophila tyrrhenica TaxID=1690608 RepID=A0AAV9P5G2_9PEZI|nr:hypothetical protein LTR77_007531 [Saxophila tyrrhenica]